MVQKRDPLYKSIFTVAGIKKHPEVALIIFCGGLGAAWATFYVGRLASYHPDVSWKHGSIPYSNERVSPQKQTKFYSPTRNYAKEESPRPEY